MEQGSIKAAGIIRSNEATTAILSVKPIDLCQQYFLFTPFGISRYQNVYEE